VILVHPGPVRRGSRHRDRVLIADNKTRELILRYTGRLSKTTGTRQPFTSLEEPSLMTSLAQHAPFLSDWVGVLNSQLANSSMRPHHLDFLAEITYSTSVDGGLFKGAHLVRAVLNTLASGAAVSLADNKVLVRYFPALAGLLQTDNSLVHGLPDYLRPVLLQLAQVGDNLRNVPQVECVPEPNVAWTPVDQEEDLKVGLSYPTSTEERKSSVYALSTRQSDIDARAGGCRKATHKFRRVLPGVAAVFCPHGICLGFHFMSSFESPETFFSLFMKRRKMAPRVIIYDNGCHFHGYAMNREPWYWRNTEVYVDAMHYWCGHVGCSIGYCIERFTFYDVINTEVAEQAFSGLDRITTCVSFMAVENATRFVRLFFWFHNENRRRYWLGTGLRTVSAARQLAIQARQEAIHEILTSLAAEPLKP
jgi:hypothetical protein